MRLQKARPPQQRNAFLRKWWRDYWQGILRTALSILLTLGLLRIPGCFLGYRFSIFDTIDFYWAKLAPVIRAGRVSVGSCYPYQYGLDVSRGIVMHYYAFPSYAAPEANLLFAPIRAQRITFQNGSSLYLAVESQEKVLSLDNGWLHVTFPPGAMMTDRDGVSLSDLEHKEKSNPWICLWTGDASCFMKLEIGRAHV